MKNLRQIGSIRKLIGLIALEMGVIFPLAVQATDNIPNVLVKSLMFSQTTISKQNLSDIGLRGRQTNIAQFRQRIPGDPNIYKPIYSPYVFNARYYLDSYGDLREEFGRNNLAAAKRHWQEFGIKEGRVAHPGFDAKYYLQRYEDLRDTFGSKGEAAYLRAIDHWLKFGIKEGRRGSVELDPPYYLLQYSDLRQTFGDKNYHAAIQHWLEFGKRERRSGAQ